MRVRVCHQNPQMQRAQLELLLDLVARYPDQRSVVQECLAKPSLAPPEYWPAYHALLLNTLPLRIRETALASLAKLLATESLDFNCPLALDPEFTQILFAANSLSALFQSPFLVSTFTLVDQVVLAIVNCCNPTEETVQLQVIKVLLTLVTNTLTTVL